MGTLESESLAGSHSPLSACISRQLIPARCSCRCLGPVTHSWVATPTQTLSLPIPIFLGQGHLGVRPPGTSLLTPVASLSSVRAPCSLPTVFPSGQRVQPAKVGSRTHVPLLHPLPTEKGPG